MTETTAAIGKPQIHSKVHFRVVGPQVKDFRRWINREFNGWIRKEFNVKGLCNGRARCRDGAWSVFLEFTGPAEVVLDRIAANFPSLQFSFGHVWEEVGRRFGASNRRVDYQFMDQNGDVWHGRNGQYEMYPSGLQYATPPRCRGEDLLASPVAGPAVPPAVMPGRVDNSRLRHLERGCGTPPAVQ